MKYKIIAHFMAIFCVLVWGTTFLSTKVLLKSFDPVSIIIYRITICVILLFIFSPKIYRLKNKIHELYFLGAGASGIAFYFILENMALKYTNASNVGVVVSMAPMFTMLFCSIILRTQRIRFNFIIGFFVAIFGIVLISYNGSKSFGLSPKGDILAVLAMICWGIYSVFVTIINSLEYYGVGSTRKIMYYGLICLIPFIFIMKADFNVKALGEFKNIMNILYLGVIASTFCFLFWNYSIKVLGPISSSIYLYLSPAITMIASNLILKEQINGLCIIGTILSILGLIISSDIWAKLRLKKSN